MESVSFSDLRMVWSTKPESSLFDVDTETPQDCFGIVKFLFSTGDGS